MSIPKEKEINCPNCGSPISYTQWDSINTMIPSAAPDLISGNLFKVKCDKCGATFTLDYPILFNDMENHVMIYYTHPEQLDETMKAASIMKMTGAQVRIVTSQNELREKAMIFRSGLDDRAVELAKIIVLEQLKEQLQGQTVDAVFFDNQDGNYSFDLFLGEQQATIGISVESIKAFADSLAQKLTEAKNEYIIDRNWAQRFLNM